MESEPLLPYGKEVDSDRKGELKRGFIRKVLGIVTVQVAITTMIVYYMISDQERVTWLKTDGIGCLIGAFIGYIAVVIAVICCKKVARQVPINYIMLLVLTVCMSYIVGFICSFYDVGDVVKAFFIAAVTSFALTVYALTAKVKLSYIVGAIIAVFVATLVVLILFLVSGFSSTLWAFYCFLGVIIYSLFLIYDVKRISKDKHGIKHDDYILGALLIYVDIIDLFLMILRAISSKN
ncbi:hypothetical protein SteCoe_12974 [Stentor coeruleus]|uniref:Uncharacterized protein n=1 Tax=Stentor coeruleus TaxID=5963 RepID=A0A1R2C9L9_9CILI|nr:hypothetical protein SteCoe_12974 [Stentor coeruleus]